MSVVIETKLPENLDGFIVETVEARLTRFGLESVWARPERSLENDEIIKIRIRFDGSGDPIDPRALVELSHEIRAGLRERREFRPPHIRYTAPDDVKYSELTALGDL
jgi:hypothetical protein